MEVRSEFYFYFYYKRRKIVGMTVEDCYRNFFIEKYCRCDWLRSRHGMLSHDAKRKIIYLPSFL